MATNTLNGLRIKLKIDSFENWTTHNPVLLKGEVALVEITAANQGSQVVPTVLMKVGDGTNHFNDLHFISANAADVYSWAKQAQKPTYAASEITGLSEFIGTAIKDTDTQYQIVANGTNGWKLQSKAKGSEEWEDVVGSTIAVSFDSIEGSISSLTSRVTAAEGTIAEHGTRLDTAEGTIAEQGTRLGTAETSITNVTDKVTTLVGDDSGKSVRTIAGEVADAKDNAVKSWVTETFEEKVNGMSYKGVAPDEAPADPVAGDFYKVTKAVSYAEGAKVGDAIIYNGTGWDILPSGDEEDTWRAVSVNGTSIGNKNLDLVAGSNISLVHDGEGKVTFNVTVPTVNDNTITIKKDGVVVDSFTLNQGTDKEINFTDNDTKYTAGDGLELTGTAFSVKTGGSASGNSHPVTLDEGGNLKVDVELPTVNNGALQFGGITVFTANQAETTNITTIDCGDSNF